MTNYANNVLYTGVTNDLVRRVYEYKTDIGSKFTSKYRITKLVYYEVSSDIKEAIKREKQIKNLVRRKKTSLINTFNPNWKDLYPEIIK